MPKTYNDELIAKAKECIFQFKIWFCPVFLDVVKNEAMVKRTGKAQFRTHMLIDAHNELMDIIAQLVEQNEKLQKDIECRNQKQ